MIIDRRSDDEDNSSSFSSISQRHEKSLTSAKVQDPGKQPEAKVQKSGKEVAKTAKPVAAVAQVAPTRRGILKNLDETLDGNFSSQKSKLQKVLNGCLDASSKEIGSVIGDELTQAMSAVKSAGKMNRKYVEQATLTNKTLLEMSDDIPGATKAYEAFEKSIGEVEKTLEALDDIDFE